MLHSQSRKTRDNSTSSAFIRVLSSCAILSIIALAVSSVSVLSRTASTAEKASLSASIGAVERTNPRTKPPTARAAAAKALLVNPLAPMAAITVDRTDDIFSASACTAAANDCSLRGAVAFANANPGTTIIVPAGTYSLAIPGGAVEGFSGDDAIGDLDVTASNTAISGAGASSTIIRQTQPNDRVIEANPFLDAGFSFSISDVTITNGHETTAVGGGGLIGGSIDNNTTITNCIFSGSSATGGGTFGGGGILYTGGNLHISGSTFTSNSTSASGGGLSYSAGDPGGRTPSTGVLTVTDSTFTSNTASSVAAGGGAADLYDFNLSTGVYNFSSSSFNGNTAPSGNGGAIVVESGGPLTITTSSFSLNSAGNRGGAILAGGSGVSVTFSRMVGNTVPVSANGLTIFSTGSSVNADDDWWGVNTGPGVNDTRSSVGSIPVITWLQLENIASPNEICAGGTSTLTADMKRRNAGPNLTVELNGLPPFPVPPAPIFANPVRGTLSAASMQFVDGSATVTFTAGAITGTGSADAFADNEVATASITIQATSATTPADQIVCQGFTANFSTSVGGLGPFSYAWTVDGSAFGGDTSNIIVPTGSLSAGNHPVTVTVNGTCGSVIRSATLTVNTAPVVTLNPMSQSQTSGSVNFTAAAAGSPAPTVQWQVSTNGGMSFSDIPGETSTTLTVAVSPAVNGNQYRAVFTNTCGSATTTAATLTTCSPPVITLSNSTLSMWPPNHTYQTFNVSDFVASATSNCFGDITSSVIITKVTSDEAENGPGSGNTLNDIVIAANCKSVQLRSEREGGGNGRVYTITFQVTDAAGNVSTATAKVTVPLSQNGAGAVDSGPHYTVNGSCP